VVNYFKNEKMKKKLSLLCLAICCVVAAKAQGSFSASIAEKFSQKAKDTLGLSETQRVQLYTINMQLESLKQKVWQKYESEDSLKSNLQKIENTRDSVYRPVFSEAQYQMYLNKKRYLLSNN
jgi:hypothetical protein